MTDRAFDEVAGGVKAPLDPGFVPAVLANRFYAGQVAGAGGGEQVRVALERENGLVKRHDISLLPGDPPGSLQVLDRHVKMLLWAHGGWRLFLSGAPSLCEGIRAAFADGGARSFDAQIMARVYGKPFAVEVVGEDDVPESKALQSRLGGHLDGCRIGFDLGASDYKLAAVQDGEPVFSTEIPWDPSKQSDPEYHYTHIVDGLKLAAEHLPRVDAIGGSSAGIYVDNEVKVASLFRAVAPEAFASRVAPMFKRIAEEWGVPLVVVNDGDVSALAGAMSLQRNAMLGLAMGSSEAAGYLDPRGCITGELNELAFAPVDFGSAAAADEWSGDRGVGALYFSQQAVNKLAPAAGFSFPDDMPLPERLKAVQAKANDGDPDAAKIFETIGVYLGYSLVHYADYYEYENVLILGRVTSGRGGELIIENARRVLSEEFAEESERIAVHVPDERSRRVGQAVAAASLPELG
jgi:predicted NBD/HSP70 family sugar kinase